MEVNPDGKGGRGEVGGTERGEAVIWICYKRKGKEGTRMKAKFSQDQ